MLTTVSLCLINASTCTTAKPVHATAVKLLVLKSEFLCFKLLGRTDDLSIDRITT